MTQTPSPAPLPHQTQDTMARHPLEFEFGLFVADHPGYGGAQGFHWFSTPEEALQWLCRDLPALFDGGDEPCSVSQSLSALLKGREALQDLPLEQINALTKGCFEVRWAGAFDDLVFGDKPFERDIQADFNAMIFPDERGQGPEGTIHEDYVVHILNYHVS